MERDKGILGTLFDFSFTEFITVRIVKILFIIGLFASGWWTVQVIRTVWWGNHFWGVVAGLISPLIFGMFVLLVRVALELTLVLFRIAEGVQALRPVDVVVDDAPAPSPVPAGPVEEVEAEPVGPVDPPASP